jgi:hypothetical protein
MAAWGLIGPTQRYLQNAQGDKVKSQKDIAKSASTPKVGLSALLSNLLRVRGTSATLAPLLVLALVATSAPTAFATGDINQETCEAFPETESSPGFSTTLPDCRAYEMASPAYTDSAFPKYVNSSYAPPTSSDGDHLLGITFGAFAGTEELQQSGNSEFGEIYEFSRTPVGWEAEPQDPPATLYPFHNFQIWSSADLAHSVWMVPDQLNQGEEPEPQWIRKARSQFVLREGAGRFAVIGPTDNPANEEDPRHPSFGDIIGASVDLNHLVVDVPARNRLLWPGDSTSESSNHQSLYEYTGVGNREPVLAGVRNKTHAPWQPGAPYLNEGAELISQCGTEFNGMSANGERIFFTAEREAGCTGTQPETSELYARIGGTYTVDISEPSKEDCAICDTTKAAREAAPEGPTYQGASEDGSKIFFTTTQKLLPGAGGDTLYEYDFAATPTNAKLTLMAPDVTSVIERDIDNAQLHSGFAQAVAPDGSRVYFASTGALTQTPNANHETPTEGSVNLYMYDTDTQELAFVAPETGPRSFDTTRDGRYFVFESASPIAETDDHSTVEQLFEYDAETHRVTRVSIGQQAPDGYQCPQTGTLQQGFDCDGNTTLEEDAPRLPLRGASDADAAKGGPASPAFSDTAVAENGAVVFSSELPLTPGSRQGRAVLKEGGEGGGGSLLDVLENVYEYRVGQVYLISAADEALPPHFADAEIQGRLLGIDESGRDVFFASADSLVPQHTSSQAAWYDAREDGGFPAPVAPPGCAGEACQGPVPAPPPEVSPLAALGANENLGPASLLPVPSSKIKPKKLTKCPKGKKLSHGNCVRPKPKAKKGTAKKGSHTLRRGA